MKRTHVWIATAAGAGVLSVLYVGARVGTARLEARWVQVSAEIRRLGEGARRATESGETASVQPRMTRARFIERFQLAMRSLGRHEERLSKENLREWCQIDPWAGVEGPRSRFCRAVNSGLIELRDVLESARQGCRSELGYEDALDYQDSRFLARIYLVALAHHLDRADQAAAVALVIDVLRLIRFGLEVDLARLLIDREPLLETLSISLGLHRPTKLFEDERHYSGFTLPCDRLPSLNIGELASNHRHRLREELRVACMGVPSARALFVRWTKTFFRTMSPHVESGLRQGALACWYGPGSDIEWTVRTLENELIVCDHLAAGAQSWTSRREILEAIPQQLARRPGGSLIDSLKRGLLSWEVNRRQTIATLRILAAYFGIRSGAEIELEDPFGGRIHSQELPDRFVLWSRGADGTNDHADDSTDIVFVSMDR